MRIYIDEAGTFIQPRTKPHFCLVLALIIPGASEAALFYEFLRLRDQWPRPRVEIKGSRLDESQVAQVAELLIRHGAIAEFYAVDMAAHPADVIEQLKRAQGHELTAHITDEHKPAIVEHFRKLAETLRRIPNQLFVQFFLTILLIFETLQTATLYFVQRIPSELGQFRWTIDRKDRTITEMEQLWTTLILPFSESRFNRQAFQRLQGADYSHFSKYQISSTTADEAMMRHLEWLRSTYDLPEGELRVIDAKRLLAEEVVFADSMANLGLQLADITASVFRRAFNRTLRRSGWEPFGALLIRKAQKMPIIRIGTNEDASVSYLDQYLTAVWRALKTKTRPMLL